MNQQEPLLGLHPYNLAAFTVLVGEQQSPYKGANDELKADLGYSGC